MDDLTDHNVVCCTAIFRKISKSSSRDVNLMG